MHKETIFDVVYDSLHYYETGPFVVFDRCCRKAFNFLDVALSEDLYRTFRTQLFYFLKDFGLLEVAYTSDATHWQVAPSTLVEIDFDTYILVGPSSLGRKVEETIKQDCTWHDVLWTRDSRISERHTHVRFLKVPRRYVSEVLSLDMIPGKVTNQAQGRLVSSLPAFSRLLPHVTEELSESTPALSTLGIESKFHFVDLSWQENTDQFVVRGLFKKSHDLRRPEYFVQDRSPTGRRSLWRVISEEWAVLMGAYLLGTRIPVFYRQSVSECGFPINIQLPTFLRRMMVLGSFCPPKVDEQGYWFSRTKTSIVDRLCEQFPVFHKRNL